MPWARRLDSLRLDQTKYATKSDFKQPGSGRPIGYSDEMIRIHNGRVDKYWADVRAKEIQDALAAQKRSTKKSKPKPKPKPKPKAAPSSAAPTKKPYENIPGVDSYVPRERNKSSNASSDSSSDSIYNYGEDYNSGDYSYRDGNEQSLRDRKGSIEDAGSLLDDWIFKIKNDEKLKASTRVDNIANKDSNYDDDDRSYSRYHTSNYY